jgi:hypothetical protein
MIRAITPAVAIVAAMLSATAASAATIPTGAWNCYLGPSWSQVSAAATAPSLDTSTPEAQLWILDGRRYALGTREDAGLYTLKGDKLVGASGPLSRVPMSAHYKAGGLGGKPTLFFLWSTAPTVPLDCQPSH